MDNLRANSVSFDRPTFAQPIKPLVPMPPAVANTEDLGKSKSFWSKNVQWFVLVLLAIALLLLCCYLYSNRTKTKQKEVVLATNHKTNKSTVTPVTADESIPSENITATETTGAVSRPISKSKGNSSSNSSSTRCNNNTDNIQNENSINGDNNSNSQQWLDKLQRQNIWLTSLQRRVARLETMNREQTSTFAFNNNNNNPRNNHTPGSYSEE